MAGKRKRTASPSKKRSKHLGTTSRTRARNRSTSEEDVTAPSESETDTIDDDLSQPASALERSTESRGSSHPSRGRATFRTPTATVSRNPSREYDGPPGRPTGRSSLRTSSPADSLSSHRSILAPFGMTRLDDNVNMMQQMQSVSRQNELDLQRERESVRKAWEDIRQQRQTLQLEREAIREREGDLRREETGRVDMNNVPADSRHLLLQLGTVMGQMSPERKRNVEGQLASLLRDCIMMKSSTRPPVPPQPAIPRALVENAQELLDFKDRLTGRTEKIPKKNKN